MSADYTSKSISEKIQTQSSLGDYINVVLVFVLVILSLFGVFPKYSFLNEQVLLLLVGIGTITLLISKFAKSLKTRDVNLRYFGTEWLILAMLTVGLIATARGNDFNVFKFNAIGVNYVYITICALLSWSLINSVGKVFKKNILFLGLASLLCVGVIFFFLQVTGKVTISNKYWDGFLLMQYIFPFAFIAVAFGFMSLWKALQFSKKMWIKYVYLFLGLILTSFYGFVAYGIRVSAGGGFTFTNGLFLLLPLVVMVLILLAIHGKSTVNNRVWYTVVLGGIVGLVMGVLVLHNGKTFNLPENWYVQFISFEESWGIVPKAISEDFGTLILGLGQNKTEAALYKYRSENVYGLTGSRVFDSLIPFSVSFALTYGLLGIAILGAFVYFVFKEILPLLKVKAENGEIIEGKSFLGVVLFMVCGLLIIPVSASYMAMFAVLLGVSLGGIYTLFSDKEKLFNIRLDLLVGNGKTGQQHKRFGVILLLVPVLLVGLYIFNMSSIVFNEVKYVKTINRMVDNEIDESIEKELLSLKDDSRKFEILARYYYGKAVSGLGEESELTDDQKKQLIDTLTTISDSYVSLESYNFNAWVVRGDIYSLLNVLSEGYYSQVVYNSYTSALQLNPLEPEIQLKIADLLLSVGEYNSAINWYAGIANTYPTYVLQANFQIGRAYVGLGKYEEALSLFNELRNYVSSNIENGTISQEVGTPVIEQLDTVIAEVAKLIETEGTTGDNVDIEDLNLDDMLETED